MKTVNIEVPKALIPVLESGSFNGAILLYMKNLEVVDGFALREDEFVTSLEDFRQASRLAGFSSLSSNIIKQ